MPRETSFEKENYSVNNKTKKYKYIISNLSILFNKSVPLWLTGNTVKSFAVPVTPQQHLNYMAPFCHRMYERLLHRKIDMFFNKIMQLLVKILIQEKGNTQENIDYRSSSCEV